MVRVRARARVRTESLGNHRLDMSETDPCIGGRYEDFVNI